MFIGHVAVGRAAKPIVPRISLAMLLVAAQLADVLWPILVAAGIEQVRIDPGNTAFTPLDFVSYPYSHSLVLLVVWGVLLGLLYRQFRPERRAVTVIGWTPSWPWSVELDSWNDRDRSGDVLPRALDLPARHSSP
jgi:hypothetical protein